MGKKKKPNSPRGASRLYRPPLLDVFIFNELASISLLGHLLHILIIGAPAASVIGAGKYCSEAACRSLHFLLFNQRNAQP